MRHFEPHIIGFLCNWCSYEGADSAGRSRIACPENLKVVRVMCSGRTDPQFIIEAFNRGADGVLILGCPPDGCHYKGGNFEALKRIVFLKTVLVQFGIAEGRLQIDWIAAGEAEKFAAVVSKMVEAVRGLGPFESRSLIINEGSSPGALTGS